jgi:hypothetical protein
MVDIVPLSLRVLTKSEEFLKTPIYASRARTLIKDGSVDKYSENVLGF